MQGLRGAVQGVDFFPMQGQVSGQFAGCVLLFSVRILTLMD